MYFNIVKAIYDKPIANSEKLKAFLLRSEARQGPLLQLLFNMVLKVLATSQVIESVYKLENKTCIIFKRKIESHTYRKLSIHNKP